MLGRDSRSEEGDGGLTVLVSGGRFSKGFVLDLG